MFVSTVFVNWESNEKEHSLLSHLHSADFLGGCKLHSPVGYTFKKVGFLTKADRPLLSEKLKP